VAIATELVIARHGEAECNVAGRVGGDKGCTGLTARGRAQADHLALRLATEHAQRPYDVIYCSPRQRCQETAEPVRRMLHLAVTTERNLRGPDHGAADGQPWATIKTAFGSALQHQPDKVIADGGESWNGYLTRAKTALEQILQQHQGQRILVVGHGETIEAVHTLLLGLSEGTSVGVWFTSGHTAIARWQLQINAHQRRTWLLAAHNDTCHLPEALR
jgi:probable phosphoglycerate mutase